MKHTDTGGVWMDVLILEGCKVWMFQDLAMAHFNSTSFGLYFNTKDPGVERELSETSKCNLL
jgi:hypothetical protein